jgi:hypothetical protein
MRILGRLAVPLWLGVIGAIVMYAFFVAIADVSPAEVAGVSVVIGALTILFAIRSIRIASGDFVAAAAGVSVRGSSPETGWCC